MAPPQSSPTDSSTSGGRNIALFDLDGTLTDPAVGIVNSLRHGMEAVGIDPEQFLPLEQFIGPPLQESFAAMGLDPAGVTAAIAGYRERFAVSGIFENRVYDGIVDILTALASAGWELAIATSKPEPFTTRILDHFELTPFFSVMAGATMDGKRRHKRDVIEHALAQLRWDANAAGRTVMIGDRNVDIAGGAAFDLTTIGVAWGYGSVEELIEAAPSAMAAVPGDLLTILDLAASD